MRRYLPIVALAACILSSAPLAAQGEGGPPSRTIAVFLDCTNFRCDFDHFRREIGFVNWVRDRSDADVHALGTAQRTAAGGREYTFHFIGRRAFASREDTLRHVSWETDTEEEVRADLTRTLKLGLVGFAARRPVAERLDVTYDRPEGVSDVAGPEDDPWDYWVFRTRVGGRADGESRTSSASVSGSFSANRTTATRKLELRVGGRYGEDRFELDDTTEFVSLQRRLDFSGLMVFALGPHWSAGVWNETGTSTFRNQELAVEGGPAIEYSLFPYEESTRRQLTLLYTIGPSTFRYEEETIFGKTRETLARHRLLAALGLRQPWGTIRTSLELSSFLHDLDRHRVELGGGLDLQVFRGLSLDLFGRVSRVQDQLHLSGVGLTREEVLVRQRELGTEFRYFVNIGFSYTFGSAFSNVVNPRFDL